MDGPNPDGRSALQNGGGLLSPRLAEIGEYDEPLRAELAVSYATAAAWLLGAPDDAANWCRAVMRTSAGRLSLAYCAMRARSKASRRPP